MARYIMHSSCIWSVEHIWSMRSLTSASLCVESKRLFFGLNSDKKPQLWLVLRLLLTHGLELSHNQI